MGDRHEEMQANKFKLRINHLLTSTTMSETIKLWFNVKGDSALTFVDIPPEQTVAHLKELIHQKAFGDGALPLAKDLVLYKVRHPLDTRLGYTHLYRQPTTRIERIPKATCLEHVRRPDILNDAIELDEGYQVAAIFSQFVDKGLLKRLKENEEDPLEVLPEHDPAQLEESSLRKKDLHIIVTKPNTGESIAYFIAPFSLTLPPCVSHYTLDVILSRLYQSTAYRVISISVA